MAISEKMVKYPILELEEEGFIKQLIRSYFLYIPISFSIKNKKSVQQKKWLPVWRILVSWASCGKSSKIMDNQ